jgi:hypothetical protein
MATTTAIITITTTRRPIPVDRTGPALEMGRSLAPRRELRMSPALLAALFAILGTGLAATSAACFVLWRRVRELTSAAGPAPVAREGPPSVSVALPGLGAGPKPTKARYELARRLDELAGRHRALEARLARIEASSIGAAMAIASHPGGPRVGRRADRGTSATSGGPTLIAVPNLASPPSMASEAAAELDRRFGAVWAMADSGAPIEVMARETGYPIGQVELILGLRRQLLAAEAGPDA